MADFIENLLKNHRDNIVQMQILFLDIVAYSKRNAATQYEIIQAFQGIVTEALHEIQGTHHIQFQNRNFEILKDTIILPTGDGLAIGIPYNEIAELALKLALTILAKVNKHNTKPKCTTYSTNYWCHCHPKFSLRCGINSGNIILYRDQFRNHFNLAGGVINLAARIMNAAGPNQVFLHEDAYKNIIEFNRNYPSEQFHKYDNITIKHGESIVVYQYIKPRTPGLNNKINNEEKPRTSNLPIDQKSPSDPSSNNSSQTIDTQTKTIRRTVATNSNQPDVIKNLEKRIIKVQNVSFIMGMGSSRQRQVFLTHSFAIDPFLVTQKLYKEVIGTNPSHFTESDQLPVDSVSWVDAVNFCNRLSTIAGYAPVYHIDGKNITSDLGKNGYRLPTEAEWEYCCWGCSNGFITSLPIETIAWFMRNSQQSTHSVGQKNPNPCGLYDMLGNLWEWCHDWFTADLPTSPIYDPTGPTDGMERVLKGGSWIDIQTVLTPSYRNRITPTTSKNIYGFRLARNNY
ncbi:MAG: SUMF1/EgtB/PvdO family nonheme iron enzyme [Magnetococcales bacterium]|nr:SUMF1/EgtB/PvdO family nonheme iron enzyme [Magnetococcales bacterium]